MNLANWAIGLVFKNESTTPVRMVDQRTFALGLPVIQGLLRCVQHEVRAHGSAYAPAHDAPGVHVDHEGHVQPALPSRNVGEVRDPQLVRLIGLEHTVDPIRRAGRLGIGQIGAKDFASNDTTQAQSAHQSLDGTVRHRDAFAVHLHPYLVGAIDLHVGLPHTLYLRCHGIIAFDAVAAQGSSMAPVADGAICSTLQIDSTPKDSWYLSMNRLST